MKAMKAKEGYRKLSTIVFVASAQTALSFTVFPLYARVPFPIRKSQSFELLSLSFADKDENISDVSGWDDAISPSTTRIPRVTNSANNIKRHGRKKGIRDKKDATIMHSDISDAVKEVLNVPFIPSEEKDEREKNQRLILPVNISKGSKIGDVNSNENFAPKNLKRSKYKTSLGKEWHRLRPGQKFRFRLGMMSIVLVSLWNTIVVRNYSGFVTGILTGAAATTTATGFGSILRRWFSSRGFQGIAALGRSIAYGWAIFVAYPRMLDRRAKERRLRREEETLAQWKHYLKGTSDEVIRLRKELSILEGEIRAFRREILSIRAARIDGVLTSPKTDDSEDFSDDKNITQPSNHNDSITKSDRILREAIINEMTHLTRLRDDTRLALTAARKRWSDVRSKRPISLSQSALTLAFDSLEFELDVAVNFEDSGMEYSNDSDDPLLAGF